jgi:hypothetical protein
MTHHLRLRRQFLRNVCLAVFLSAMSSFALAQNLSFFSASIPVKAQSASERERAATLGLRQVMVRMSGVTQLDDYPDLPAALSRASRSIEQFHYAQVKDRDGVTQEHLVMTFSTVAVEAALQQAGLPYWPVNRPSILVWLVEDDVAEGKNLINDPSVPVVQGLLEAAQQRGLPLRFPLLDLDDQLAINAEQVWNLNEKAILDASSRYGADTVLLGRYTRTFSGQWWTTWQFFHKGEGRLYDLRNEDAVAVGQQALAPLADHLAEFYALKSNRDAEGAAQLYVQVRPVANFGTYRKTLDYLDRLAVVTTLGVAAVTQDSLLLSLQLNGDWNQLLKAISLDNKLRARATQSVEPWMAAGGIEQPLQLEWIGR